MIRRLKEGVCGKREVDAIAAAASGLTPDQEAQLQQASQVMLGIERARLEPVLARHLRQGTSKYARSVPKEGIRSVTLSLSGALWVSRAWVALLIGLIVVLPIHGMPPVRIFGLIVVGCGVVLWVLGAARLASAVRSRRDFRQAQSIH